MGECIHRRYLIDGKSENSEFFCDEMVNSGISYYEVLRIIEGRYLYFEDHIKRLINSIRTAGDKYNFDYLKYAQYLMDYKNDTGIREGNIKIVINLRESAPDIPPKCYVYQIRHLYPSASEYSKGVVVSLLNAERSNPNAKFINHTIHGMVSKELGDKPVYETLFVNENDAITEGSRTNVFFIIGDRVYASPDDLVLQGITRKHVLEICYELNITVSLSPVLTHDLPAVDAVFLSGTSVKVLPVKQVEHFPFGVSNSLMRKIMKAYDDRVDNYINHAKFSGFAAKDIF